MNYRIALICIALTFTLAPGCAPTISYRVDMKVYEDASCKRKVIVKGTAHEKLKSQQVKLHDYLDLPDADAYDHFVLTPSTLILGGSFESPDMIPSDFVKQTMHTDKLAKNRVLFRHIDMVLIRFMDFEERIDDIVERSEGEKALVELNNLVLDELLALFESRFGEDYDLSAAKEFLRAESSKLAVRLYARLWEMRRSKRGGIAFMSEDREWRNILAEEARRQGVEIVGQDDEEDGDESKQKKILTEWVNQKLNELTSPRAEGGAALRVDFLEDKDARTKLLTDLQESVSQRHGSVKVFLEKIEPLLPKIFGAFLISEYSIIPTNPQFDFQVRLDLPGTVIQTNGLQDLDGKLLWSFTERDLGLTGTAMWARTVVIDQEAVKSLGLKDFPGHLNVVERYFREFRGPGGKPNKDLVEVMRACVETKSVDPLNALSLDEKMDERTRRSAANLLSLFKHFQPGETEKTSSDSDEVVPDDRPESSAVSPDLIDPEIEEIGTDGLSAPGRERKTPDASQSDPDGSSSKGDAKAPVVGPDDTLQDEAE